MDKKLMCSILSTFLLLFYSADVKSVNIVNADYPDFAFPKTVIKEAEVSLKKAISNKNDIEAIRALIDIAVANGEISIDNLPASIRAIKNYRDLTDNKCTKSILNILLANIYSDYYNRNSYKFDQRTIPINSEDWNEWSGKQFKDSIVELCQAALENHEELEKTSLDTYTPIISAGVQTLIYYPTLYDFIAIRSIDFLKPINNQMVIDIFNKLIEYHNNDYAARINYLINKCQFDSKSDNNSYLLDLYKEFYDKTEYSGDILYALNSTSFSNDNKNQYFNLINEFLLKYKAYWRNDCLHQIIDQLTSPVLTLNAPKFCGLNTDIELQVHAENIKDAKILIYQLSDDTPFINGNFESISTKSIGAPNTSKYCKLLKKIPVTFNDTKPFEVDTIIKSRISGYGRYVICLEEDGIETDKGSTKWIPVLTCTDLSLLSISSDKSKLIVVNNITGAPVDNATIYKFDTSKSIVTTQDVGKSNSEGFFNYDVTNKWYESFSVKKGNDIFGRKISLGKYKLNDVSKPIYSGQGFVDMPIYKPGDKVSYVYIVNKLIDSESNVLENIKLRAILYNANYLPIDTIVSTSDKLGRVTGEFKIPEGELTGDYRIIFSELSPSRDINYSFSQLNFTVSDFKLPSYSVTITNIDKNMPTKGAVTISGKVMSYAGVGLNNVNIDLILFASERFYWRTLEKNEIFRANSTTDNNGIFKIQVDSEILNSSPLKNEMFIAEIKATTSSGESQETSATFALSPVYNLAVSFLPTNKNSIQINGTGATPINIELKDSENKLLNSKVKVEAIKDGKIVADYELSTNDKSVDLSNLKSGIYNFKFSAPIDSIDNNCNKVEINNIIIFRLDDKTSPVDSPLWVECNNDNIKIESNKYELIYAVPSADSHVLLCVSHHEKVLQNKWLKSKAGINKYIITIPDSIDEINVNLFSCRNFVSSQSNFRLTKINKKNVLNLQVSSFRDHSVPGAKEHWKFTTTDYVGKGINAALIIGVYNKMLNSLVPETNWKINVKKPYYNNIDFSIPYFNQFYISGSVNNIRNTFNCRTLNPPNFQTYGYGFMPMVVFASSRMYKAAAMTNGAMIMEDSVEESTLSAAGAQDVSVNATESFVADAGQVENISTDNNTMPSLREGDTRLALFNPMLSTNDLGELEYSFDLPLDNTTWVFNSVAYTKDLKNASFHNEIVCNKPYMVKANIARFYRIGDLVEISSMLINNTDSICNLNYKIEIYNPISNKFLCQKIGSVEIPAKLNVSESIKVEIPNDVFALGFRILCDSNNYSDGEQHIIPVLPASQPVVETYPFYISPDSLNFKFQIPQSISGARLTLQYCNNPSWYVLTALPGLHKADLSTAQDAAYTIFSAAMARGLIKNNPVLGVAIKEWIANNKTDSVLTSMLNKNQDLKSILLSATPWMRDALTDTERMERMALLFDNQNIDSTIKLAIETLERLQNENGGWQWASVIKEPSYWATESVLSILGKLNEAGYMPNDKQLNKIVGKALDWYQKQNEQYFRNNPHSSFYRFALLMNNWRNQKITLSSKQIINKEVQSIIKYWKKYDVGRKAECILLLKNNGYVTLANTILNSITEFSKYNPQKGMWWPSVTENSWSNLEEISVTSKVLNAYSKIRSSSSEIDKIRQWLILQKGAQNWGESSVATDVIYSIVSTSGSWLSKTPSPQISINGEDIKTNLNDNYLGNFEIDLSQYKGGILEISKSTGTPSWGAVYSQYIQSIKEIKQKSIDDIKIEKNILRYNNGKWELTDSLHVGDKARVQLIVKTERSIQYATISDHRPACFEPVDQLPMPIYSEGIYFYRENKDTETRLFITNLPKGTYILEYDMYVNSAGNYTQGIATIQSQYAPEISAHTAGSVLNVE